MKFLLSSVFFAIVSATDIISVEWAQYKEKYMKVYTTAYEDTQRLEQYLKTKQMIEEHNKKFLNGEVKYTLDINQFADWHPKELGKMTSLKLYENRARGEAFELAPDTDLPDSINWIDKGAVTKVKNQGACGSCYAFSAAGALEGLMFIKNGTITDLSAQELVDCSSNYGCNGGVMTTCFSYVEEHNGIATEEAYPYEGEKGLCRADEKQIGASCTGWKELPQTEIALQRAVGNKGPVSTGFAVSEHFMFYKDGIYDGPCAARINHAMLIVGYDRDEESDEDFWIIKNSWGLTWGDKGYAKVKRGYNLCDINTLNSFPTYL